MKLQWMLQDLASARRSATFLIGLLVAAMLANLVLATLALQLAGHERVVIVPPAIHKTFWVEADQVSPEYLEQMGYFLLQLTLDVTPQSVDQQAKLLLQYATPSAYGELNTSLLAAAERLKRDGAATVFSAQDLSVDARRFKVGVRGQLTTFIGDRRVSDVTKGYAIEFLCSGGRVFLKSFRETNPNDPLELQAHTTRPAGTVAAGA